MNVFIRHTFLTIAIKNFAHNCTVGEEDCFNTHGGFLCNCIIADAQNDDSNSRWIDGIGEVVSIVVDTATGNVVLTSGIDFHKLILFDCAK